jgi:UDP-N-acetyl-D-galactosamine dehydrogenase
MSFPDKPKIAVIGLGYVGLPLAVEFGKHFETVGFDINAKRIEDLKRGFDATLEVDEAELKSSSNLHFSCEIEDLRSANFYIVTVPTPVDDHKQPDLTPLIRASTMLGKVVTNGDVIVYESTDKEHRLTTIKKITSGSNPEVAEYVDRVYRTIVTAGTHKASSIRVAEAAKVIENTQRDLNIALVNELALIFNKMGIDTLDVLEAAGTKWNFLPFRPGLV